MQPEVVLYDLVALLDEMNQRRWENCGVTRYKDLCGRSHSAGHPRFKSSHSYNLTASSLVLHDGVIHVGSPEGSLSFTLGFTGTGLSLDRVTLRNGVAGIWVKSGVQVNLNGCDLLWCHSGGRHPPKKYLRAWLSASDTNMTDCKLYGAKLLSSGLSCSQRAISGCGQDGVYVGRDGTDCRLWATEVQFLGNALQSLSLGAETQAQLRGCLAF